MNDNVRTIQAAYLEPGDNLLVFKPGDWRLVKTVHHRRSSVDIVTEDGDSFTRGALTTVRVR